jgi:5'-deoxynucleotidase YfbR-like HD superfamily hydrolase
MSKVASLLEELSHFPGREEGLRKIMRYTLYSTVFYRFSDFSHSKRVAWHIVSVAPLLLKIHPDLDIHLMLVIALVHDDAELVTGDYQAGNKSKMTPEQLAALDQEERDAIAELAERFPKTIGGYVYQDLLLDVMELKSKEAQIVKYLDRQDALGEALHELYGGNTTWTVNVVNEFGTIPTPFDFYLDKQPKMIEKHPVLVALKDSHPFFSVPELRDWKALVPTCKPHTKDSISALVGHPQYDAWRQMVLALGDSEEVENLYTQREFI